MWEFPSGITRADFDRMRDAISKKWSTKVKNKTQVSKFPVSQGCWRSLSLVHDDVLILCHVKVK